MLSNLKLQFLFPGVCFYKIAYIYRIPEIKTFELHVWKSERFSVKFCSSEVRTSRSVRQEKTEIHGNFMTNSSVLVEGIIKESL